VIVLMRHAQTEGGSGRYIGRTSLPLSETGKRQARELAQTLWDADIGTLCSSPSSRAVETTAPLAARLGLEVKRISGLDEIDLGSWEGLRFEEVRTMDPEGYEERGKHFANFRPPGGECFNDVADRALAALHTLAAMPQNVLAVTHAGVIRSVLCRLTGRPMNQLFHFMPEHTKCTVLKHTTAGLESMGTAIDPADLLHTLG